MNTESSSSPTIVTDGCEICGCPSCPTGYRVTIPDAIVQWESLEVPEDLISCADLEEEMFQGRQQQQQQLLEISNDVMVDVCSDTLRLDALFRSTCGCPTLPTVTVDDGSNLPSATTTVTDPIVTIPTPLIRPAESIDPETILLGDDPVAVVRQHPVLVACIIVGAFAVAGIYLVCQLRCTREEPTRFLKEDKNDEEEQVVQVAATSTTMSKDMDLPTQEEAGATERTTTEADQFCDEIPFQSSTPEKMIYIMTDDLESVSDYGSVVSSYNVQL